MSTRHMVENQVKPRGVNDPLVLEAVTRVDRSEFVPEDYKHFAFSDCPLPLSHGQTISQPYMVAAMTELLKPQKQSRILEIGTGSGYQTAILAEIVAEVYTIEIIEDLSSKARRLLEQKGYNQIQYKVGNGWHGWPEAAPFDGIIFTAAPENAPVHLQEQLNVGGRMIVPCGPTNGTQILYLFEKDDSGNLLETKIMGVRFVPLTGNHDQN